MRNLVLQHKRTTLQVFESALTSMFPQQRSAATTVSSGGFLGNIFGGSGSVSVNEQSALTLSAFFNGVELIGNDIAKLGVGVFERTDKGKKALPNHSLHYLLTTEPNQYMGAFNFKKIITLYAILKGNFYALIERNAFTAQPQALQILEPEHVTVKKYNDQLFYTYKGKTYNASDIFHVTGFTTNGITGISVIRMAAKSLGVGLTSQDFSTEYYNSKGIGAGVVTHPQQLKPGAKTSISAGFSKAMASVMGSYKVAVLDEGMTFNPFKITAEEAQFLATNKAAVEECARWLNLPPHKLKNLDRSTNNNIEHQSIEHVGDSILPWVKRIEEECARKLFASAEKRTNFVKFNIRSLYRADLKSQTEHVSKMYTQGIYSKNESRKYLDKNPVDGGDEFLTPVNVYTEEMVKNKEQEEVVSS